MARVETTPRENASSAAPSSSPPGKPPRRGILRRKRVWIPIVLFIAAVLGGVWYWYKNLRGFVSTDDAFLDADRVELSAKVLGRIVELSVDEGDRVTRGQVLVRLDDTDLRSQVDQARAGLGVAENSLPLAKVNLDRASDDYARAEVQFKGAVITREQHVHARQALEAAQAEYRLAQSRVDLARAQLAVVETQLLNMTLTAPFDGFVAKRWMILGDVVQPGQPILSIYHISPVWITVNLEETKLARVKLRDPVEVSIDAYPGRKFSGRVGIIFDYTASQFSLIPPNNASGNFTKVTQRVPMRIYLDDLSPRETAAYPLRPGLSVEVKIRVDR
jgi:membrane fusion protein (multidrug efflux system)